MGVRRSKHLRCPLCGYLLYTDGARHYCPRMIPDEGRRCGHNLKGGLDAPDFRLALPSIAARIAMIRRPHHPPEVRRLFRARGRGIGRGPRKKGDVA